MNNIYMFKYPEFSNKKEKSYCELNILCIWKNEIQFIMQSGVILNVLMLHWRRPPIQKEHKGI